MGRREPLVAEPVQTAEEVLEGDLRSVVGAKVVRPRSEEAVEMLEERERRCVTPGSFEDLGGRLVPQFAVREVESVRGQVRRTQTESTFNTQRPTRSKYDT